MRIHPIRTFAVIIALSSVLPVFSASAKQISASPKQSLRVTAISNHCIDEFDEEHGVAVARSTSDAPEIDGNVFIENIDLSTVSIGQFINVTITDTDEYDLFAERADL